MNSSPELGSPSVSRSVSLLPCCAPCCACQRTCHAGLRPCVESDHRWHVVTALIWRVCSHAMMTCPDGRQVVDSFLRHHLHADIIAQALDLSHPDGTDHPPSHTLTLTHSRSETHSASSTQVLSELPSGMRTEPASAALLSAATGSSLPVTSNHSSTAVPLLSMGECAAWSCCCPSF